MDKAVDFYTDVAEQLGIPRKTAKLLLIAKAYSARLETVARINHIPQEHLDKFKEGWNENYPVWLDTLQRRFRQGKR